MSFHLQSRLKNLQNVGGPIWLLPQAHCKLSLDLEEDVLLSLQSAR